MSIKITIHKIEGCDKKTFIACGEVDAALVNQWLFNLRDINGFDTEQPGKLILETIDTAGCLLIGISREGNIATLDGGYLWHYEITGTVQELDGPIDNLTYAVLNAELLA